MNKTLRTKFIIAGSAAVITFIVFLPSLMNEFVNWDDNVYIYENTHIHPINAYLFKWAFLNFYAANWHPLTWISHAIDYAIWGLNPFGHHLTNNILHAANTFIVVLLMCRLLEIYKQRTIAIGAATFFNDQSIMIAGGIAGLLFGIHPIHVESVAWVSERKDLLCALFFLLSVMMYAEYACSMNEEAVQKRTRSGFLTKDYLFSVGFFILALLSKPMAVSLPFVLLILDWFPFKRTQSIGAIRLVILEKLPFIILSFGSSVLTLLAQKEGGSMNIKLMAFVPFWGRMLVAAKSLIAYLWNMIAPMNLIPYYPYPKYPSFFSLEYLSAIILVAGITTVCMVMAKRQRLWLSVWLYFVATLVPVIGIVQVGGQSMADRYTYLPGLGPCLAAGIGAAWVLTRVQQIDVWGQKVKLATSAVIFVLFASMIYLTVNQIRIWRSSFTLWSDVIEKKPGEIPMAYHNLGFALMASGQFDKAIENFNIAIALDPYPYKELNQRGAAFLELGQLDKAIDDFDRAIAIAPYYDEPYYNRGIAYGKSGFYDKAVESVSQSLAINPNRINAYIERGIDYMLNHQLSNALADFNTAIYLNGNNALAYSNRGYLYQIMGNTQLAIADYQKACYLGDEKGCKRVQDIQLPIRMKE